MHTQQRRIGFANISRTGFSKPDEFSQLRKPHVVANLALWGEQRFSRQPTELESRAQARYHLALGVGDAQCVQPGHGGIEKAVLFAVML